MFVVPNFSSWSRYTKNQNNKAVRANTLGTTHIPFLNSGVNEKTRERLLLEKIPVFTSKLALTAVVAKNA